MLLRVLTAQCFLRCSMLHSIETTTCKCRYHACSGYFAVTMDRLSVLTSLTLFCRVQVCASCASCAKGSGSRWCLHRVTAFARDHTSEPIHLQRVWTLQIFADYRPYVILGAFFHLPFLCTVLRETCICQTTQNEFNSVRTAPSLESRTTMK